MEQNVAVWYNGALAIYKISGGDGGIFNAELVKYDGTSEASPPTEFLLYKEGRHWSDDDTNQDLLDDLGKAIEIKNISPGQISNPRIYNAGRRQ